MFKMDDRLSLPPSTRSLILAGMIALAMTVAVALIFPEIDSPTPLGTNLRPVQVTALTVVNGIIAYLVLLQFYVNHKLSFGILGAAFAYSALMSGYQLFHLPGVFLSNSSYQPGSHVSVLTWIGRLGGTATLILLAMLAQGQQHEWSIPKRARPLAVALAVLGPAGLAWCMVNILPSWMPDLSHLVLSSGDYSALTHSWAATFLLTAWIAALLSVLIITRLASMFHCWLALSCYSYVLYLVIVFSSSIRFTVGWHASRFFEFSASAIMLGALLFEVLKLQKGLQRAYHQVYEESIRDGLTGLFSRRYFNAVLEQSLLRQQRHPTPLTLLIADIDFFKQYNDGFGHVQGDLCIQKVTACMAEQLRGDDTVARYGGEEFIAILQDCDAHQAHRVAERFRSAVEKLAIVTPPGSLRGVITVSIGLYCHPPGTTASPGWLVEQADRALYNAKREGRNRIGLPELAVETSRDR